jgi:hypothetical protein
MELMIREIYEREIPKDETRWHKWNTLLWPVRTIDGRWTWGIVWRRKTAGVWQFQQREETAEEWWRRQY